MGAHRDARLLDRDRHLLAAESPAALARLGTEAFDEALARRTLSVKLPMWRDYARQNLRWAVERAGGRGDLLPRHLRPFTRLARRFSDVPTVVIGFGPSFHRHRELLCTLRRDRCRLVATDRALPLLWEAGCLPDVVVNLDSGDQTRAFAVGTPRPYLEALVQQGWIVRSRSAYRALRSQADWSALRADRGAWWRVHPLLPTDECGKIFAAVASVGPLSLDQVAEAVGLSPRPVPGGAWVTLLAMTSNPGASTWFRGPKYWYLPYLERRLSRALERLTGQPCLLTAGNVGTTAMNLSVILGARPVYLVGMDFGYDLAVGFGKDQRETTTQGMVGDPNLAAYAVATRALLVHPDLRLLYEASEVTNLSGGILHGPFIARGDARDLPDLLRRRRLLPAPATTRPAGRNLKSVIAA